MNQSTEFLFVLFSNSYFLYLRELTLVQVYLGNMVMQCLALSFHRKTVPGSNLLLSWRFSCLYVLPMRVWVSSHRPLTHACKVNWQSGVWSV